MATRCRCSYPGHQLGCKVRSLHDERGRLYDGLYDGQSGPPPRGGGSSRVRLLNPELVDGDATSRRFAQLEID